MAESTTTSTRALGETPRGGTEQTTRVDVTDDTAQGALAMVTEVDPARKPTPVMERGTPPFADPAVEPELGEMEEMTGRTARVKVHGFGQDAVTDATEKEKDLSEPVGVESGVEEKEQVAVEETPETASEPGPKVQTSEPEVRVRSAWVSSRPNPNPERTREVEPDFVTEEEWEVTTGSILTSHTPGEQVAVNAPEVTTMGAAALGAVYVDVVHVSFVEEDVDTSMEQGRPSIEMVAEEGVNNVPERTSCSFPDARINVRSLAVTVNPETVAAVERRTTVSRVRNFIRSGVWPPLWRWPLTSGCGWCAGKK